MSEVDIVAPRNKLDIMTAFTDTAQVLVRVLETLVANGPCACGMAAL